MRFDPRHSKWVAWLNLVAALITLAGLFGKVTGQSVLGPLQVAVPIPLWLLLAALIFAPTLPYLLNELLSKRRVDQPARVDQPTTDTHDSEKDYLISNMKAEVAEAHRELSITTHQLAEYSSLEREILALLASGSEFDLTDILQRVSVKHEPDGSKKVRLAVASLHASGKVVGTGGALPKLRIAAVPLANHSAT